MATWVEQTWQNERVDGPRRDRRSGSFLAYRPDHLAGSALLLSAALDADVAQAERDVRSLRSDTEDLASVARFLLRSEAIASSRIEGIAPSARQVALAELGQREQVSGISAPARLVADNMILLRQATSRLLDVPMIEVADLVGLQAALLADEPRLHGIRKAQNWIGGSAWHPLEADFVPPPPELVAELMSDLVTYLAGGAHSPVVQAALVHAQFETIHPFADGNGRVGRALIHTVLARRGLTEDSVLPISLVFSTLSDGYVQGLTAFRHGAAEGSPSAVAAREAWIGHFVAAVRTAAAQARQVAAALRLLRTEWEQRLARTRGQVGKRALRSDSATSALLADLPATPVVTVAAAADLHAVSAAAAGRALDELREAGILTMSRLDGKRAVYVAAEVLDLITWAERRLGSTQFDTRVSTPRAGVPARPARHERRGD